MNEYKKLNKYANYDQEAVEEMVAALEESQILKDRLNFLEKLVFDNENLHPFIWRTAEGKLLPLHKIEDDHLKNILQHLVNTGRTISQAIRAEAEKRNFNFPTRDTDLALPVGEELEPDDHVF